MESSSRNQTAAYEYQRLGWQVRDRGTDADGASVADGTIAVLPDAEVDAPAKKADTVNVKIG